MKLLMIMPAVRWWLWPLIKANYESAMCEGVEPRLVLGVFPNELKAMPSCVVDLIRSTKWITIYDPEPIPNQGWAGMIIQKNNGGLGKFLPGFDGYVWTPSDDNLIPKRFFSEFLKAAQTGKKAIIFSHRRGQRNAASGYGTEDLIAAPHNVKCCQISGEQYILHSSLYEGRRFNVSPTADGELIVDVYSKHPEEFHFVPDFFIPFNATEPGRFDNDKLKEILDA
jgi:hypothetical protein